EHQDEDNLVFSPFGYSTIFAILEEGSGGETEQELQKVLKLSKENTRSTFTDILTSLKERYTINLPQLKTWFYVYKNFSVNEEYKKILLENYLTVVKNVFPHEYEQLEYDKVNENSSTVKPTSVMTEQEGNSPHKEKLAIEEAEKEYEAIKLVTGDNKEGEQINEKEKPTEVEKEEETNVGEKKYTEGDASIKEVNYVVNLKEKLQNEGELEFDARKILPVRRSSEGTSDVVIILACILTTVTTKPRFSRETHEQNAVGYSTKVISSALLKEHQDEDNLVFSPFGYSTIFAILEEGSGGETEQELQKVLKLSKENTRSTFTDILTSLKERYTINLPQLKTWFYVYKNFSVNEEYKKILLENYLTVVKNVFPHEYEQLEYDKVNENSSTVKPTSVMTEQEGNSPHKEKLAIEEAEKEYEAIKLVTGDNKEGEQINEKEKPTEVEKEEETNVGEKKYTEGDASIKEVNYVVNLKEKLQNEGELEFDARKILPVRRSSEGTSDVDIHSMIIFNGLYFEGKWAAPFHDEVTLKDFHVNENVTMQIETVTSKGLFKMADIPKLNSTALLLPFQSGRYSFLIILPWECNGLDNLVSKIDATTLGEVYGNLQEIEAEIEIPVIAMESTTKPEPAMCKTFLFLSTMGAMFCSSRESNVGTVLHGNSTANKMLRQTPLDKTETSVEQ
ncbi:hypothetical protein J437_LFUL004226, partial [Ladona fulva]